MSSQVRSDLVGRSDSSFIFVSHLSMPWAVSMISARKWAAVSRVHLQESISVSLL